MKLCRGCAGNEVVQVDDILGPRRGDFLFLSLAWRGVGTWLWL
jgi:hypothetical protein